MENRLESEFCSYEQALSLKELGYQDKCIATIQNNGYIHIKGTRGFPSAAVVIDKVDVPLKQQVFRWFREKYNLWSYVYPYIHDKDWHFHIQFYNSEMWGEIHLGNKFNTYEEAENACIDKLLELAKEQKKIDLIAEISGW